MARTEKVEKVRALTSRFRDASGAMLADYRGLTVKDVGELRRALRAADASFVVSKNTLTRLAAKDAGLEGLVPFLEGPTAVAFMEGDGVAGAKALLDAAKRFPALEVKGAFIEGHVMDGERAKALASIDAKDVSVAKIAGMLEGPPSRIAYLLQAPPQRIAFALAERGRQQAA